MPRRAPPVAATERRNRNNKWATIRFTDPQLSLLKSTRPVEVFWGANSCGKSVVMAWDIARFLEGEHPFDQTHKPPVHALMLGESWEGMAHTIDYLWQFLDKRHFKESLSLEGGKIKGQETKIYDIVAGPGKGGQLRLATYSSGPKRIAGPRYHRIVTDEPMPQDIWSEVYARTLGRNGHIRIGFTPTMKTTTHLKYLWELVDDEDSDWIGEINVPLTLANVTPRGGLLEVPFVSADQIKRFGQGLPKAVRAMRMGLSRYPVDTDRYLSAWNRELCRPLTIGGGPGHPPLGSWVLVGIDHGTKPGRQRAVISACIPEGFGYRFWVLEEVYFDGRTGSDEDARLIMEALERRDIALEDVDYWVGDRAHPGDKYSPVKSNVKLLNGFARLRGCQRSDREMQRRHRVKWLPPALYDMFTPSKYRASHWEGANRLNELMADGRLVIDTKCEQLIDDIETWNGSERAEQKDGIDALRYPVMDVLDGYATLKAA